MKRVWQIRFGFLIAVGLALMSGCSSEPKDPFEDWDAATKYKEFVPPTANRVAGGTGVLEYTAPENGRLYVLDTTSTVMVEEFAKPTVVVAGYLPSGTHVIFDPNEKRAYVKGREGVRLTDVTPGHTHELRFDPIEKKKQ